MVHLAQPVHHAQRLPVRPDAPAIKKFFSDFKIIPVWLLKSPMF
jgi:hypothetical protein